MAGVNRNGNGNSLPPPKLTESTLRGLRAALSLINIELDTKELSGDDGAALCNAYRFIAHIIESKEKNNG